MRRTQLAVLALAVVGAFAAPALASNIPPVPVGVGIDSQGRVCVGGLTWVPQCVDPIVVGAKTLPVPPSPVWVYRTADGSVCAGYSTTRPVCTPPLNVATAQPAMSLPLPSVTVVNNSYAVGVLIRDGNGQPIGAAVVAKDGSNACIGLSYQVPFCLN